MTFKERKIVLMHLSENIRVIVVRDRLFDFLWGIGWGRDYLDPGFFLRTPEPGFLFCSQDHAYKSKKKV